LKHAGNAIYGQCYGAGIMRRDWGLKQGGANTIDLKERHRRDARCQGLLHDLRRDGDWLLRDGSVESYDLRRQTRQ
jgi:hypothetical protein